MNVEEKYIDLIAKFLALETSAEEQEELFTWVNASAENQKAFDAYSETWAQTDPMLLKQNIDVDKEWQHLSKGVSETKVIPLEPTKTSNKIWMRIAAAVLIILLPAYLIFKLASNQNQTLVAEMDVLKTSLSDGSVLELNKGSILRLNKKTFGDKTREVKLEGECFFEVKRDEQKPFIIEAGDYNVEVLGTSFYVNNNESEVIVMVKSGKVGVYKTGEREKMIVLEPGEKGVFGAKEEVTQTSDDDSNELAWQTKKLSFKNKKLGHIVKKLNRLYNSDIVIESKDLENCRLTATFDKQPLEEVLHVIEATLNVSFEKKGNKIMLKGDGC